MPEHVYLQVKNGKVDAYEGIIQGDGGHLNVKPHTRVKWHGDYEGGNFVVTFFDVSNGLQPGWPFEGPVPGNLELLVEGDGKPAPLLKLKDATALWKYDVEVQGSTTIAPLDPVIIVRESSGPDAFLVAAIAFVAGLVAAMVLNRLRSR